MKANSLEQIKLLAAYKSLCNPEFIKIVPGENLLNKSKNNCLYLQDQDGSSAEMYLNKNYDIEMQIKDETPGTGKRIDGDKITIKSNYSLECASKRDIRARTISNIQLVAYLNNVFDDNANLKMQGQVCNSIEFIDDLGNHADITRDLKDNKVHLYVKEDTQSYIFSENGNIYPYMR